MSCGLKCSKGLKICCGVTSIFLIVVLVILLVLFLTDFKRKDPTITLQSVKFGRFMFDVTPIIDLNASLAILVTVDNPNHGSFTYQNSTAYLHYRGRLLAEAPLHEDTIPALKSHNISTVLNVYVDVTEVPDLLGDYLSGIISFTSITNLVGKVKILKFIKIKATSYSTCEILVYTRNQTVNSICNIQLKL
ncbi:unnamed protein product [Vicia faba]|uniref:Late embryogenesis abundant protein LEA-2 subgroup domain-containing protein n=1 Tax=Vicia faba TaxID=3906 RepID=A0AAV0YZP0_VICFA|nr:unnamed protein product [Vicia faba]